MIDYSKKAAVINSGLVDKVKDLKRRRHFTDPDDEATIYLHDWEEILLQNDDPDAYKEAQKIIAADTRRNTRLKHKVEKLMQMGDCVFLTLTFNDDALKLKPRTRRDMVTRYLKSCSKYYIANIDFGKKNEREHYHAIVLSSHINMSGWKYGFAFAKHIIKASNPLILAKYINKLTNHAIKETCKRNSLIYSRVDWQERSDDYWNAVAPLVD